jgi:hypothetical protein
MEQSGRKTKATADKRNGRETRFATCEPLLTVATSCDHLCMEVEGVAGPVQGLLQGPPGGRGERLRRVMIQIAFPA